MDLRKIDALVCVHVMGWTWDGYEPVERPRVLGAESWSPSSDIAHAWEVVEKLRSDGWRPIVDHSHPGETTVEIEFGEVGDDGHMGRFYVTRETAPLAICAAALRALQARGVDVDSP